MDKFYEQLLTTKKNAVYYILNIMMYFITAITALFIIFTVLSANLFYFVYSIIAVILIFLLRYARDRQYKEFEYIFTNGNLQIDIIYNKKKRKTLIDEEVREFEIFGKTNEVSIENKVRKIICIPWDNKSEVYIFMPGGKDKKAVYIAPNNEMLKLINLYYIPRFIKK